MGADVEFAHLVTYLGKLEETSSQNVMIGILSRLFHEAGSEEIPVLCYFLQGRIAPDYQEITLDIGERKVVTAISEVFHVPKKELEQRLEEVGDLGSLTASFDIPPHVAFTDHLTPPRPLTVRALYEGLSSIASSSGEGSDPVKISQLASLLAAATPGERRYIVRLVTGTMRLGVGDMTILDGLAVAFLGSKQERSALERAYYLTSDLGYVASVLQEKGLPGIQQIRITLGRPIHAMLAQRVGRMEEILDKIPSRRLAVEEKFDGERIQAHKQGDTVQLFSRRLTQVTRQFPDIVAEVQQNIQADTIVLDGEAVAYDPDHGSYFPFQNLMQRRRKYRVEEYARKIPVRYMVFDLLYLDGISQMERTYPERRARLEKILTPSDRIGIAGRTVTSTLEGIRTYFQASLDRGLEGVICKSMADSSFYEPGSRSWQWIKWKKAYGSEMADTLDLVVLGGNMGRGRRKGTYGSLLCAAYAPERDRFETVCGLGTGFTDAQLAELPATFHNLRRRDKPARCEVREESVPDHWFEPVHVLEVLGGEITRSRVHTCNWDDRRKQGMALRFPRFILWRPEKSAEQATTSAEIAAMYEEQRTK